MINDDMEVTNSYKLLEKPTKMFYFSILSNPTIFKYFKHNLYFHSVKLNPRIFGIEMYL